MPQAFLDAEKHRQKICMLLSAIGIFMVADLHSRSSFGLLTGIFPYESFLIPLFVFTAGVLFRSEEAARPLKYIRKQIRQLLFPYAALNGVYAVAIAGLQQHCSQLRWSVDFAEFPSGSDSSITGLVWLLPILFGVRVLYMLIRQGLPHQINWLTLLFLILLGSGCVGLVSSFSFPTWVLFLLKIGFYLPFFHLGVFYREDLEARFLTLPKLTVLLAAVSINVALLLFGQPLTNGSLDSFSNSSGGLFLLSLITGLTGIGFWLALSSVMAPVLGKSRLIAAVSHHSLGILCHYMAVFTAFDWLLARLPFTRESFDWNAFTVRAGHYTMEFPVGIRYCYVWVGLFGALGLCIGFDKLKEAALFLLRSVQNRKKKICVA